MPTLTERIQTALRDASPVAQRLVVGGAGAGVGALVGGLIGGRGGARVSTLIGGGVGGFFGPQIAKLLGGTSGIREQIEEQVDTTLGVVPAVEQATKAETGIMARVLRLARGAGEGRGTILQREQARLRAREIEPVGGNFSRRVSQGARAGLGAGFGGLFGLLTRKD